MTTFDTIIIGAGSAGCVLANRLGADPSRRILVVEAGPMDRDLMIHIPAGVYRAWRDPRINWNYATAPEPDLQDREVFVPRGRVVGGSSSINSMVYMRGHPLDYDAWASEHGLTNWRYDHCLPYFRAGESSDRAANAYRGGDGPLLVSRAGFDNPLYDAFVAAGAAAGQGHTDDPSGFQPEGVARLDATKRSGRRCSAAIAHLRPALRRGNVTLMTSAMVERIIFDGDRATGIEFRHRGTRKTATAETGVILSGGAINSPKLLMQSGIGPAHHLAEHDIPLRADLPGVGRNLQEHACIIMQFASLKSYPIQKVDTPWRKAAAGAQWVFTRRGIATSNIWEAGGLIRGNEQVPYANLQYHFGPVGFDYDGGKIRLKQAFAIHVDVLRPKSRGHVTLTSADPAAKPRIVYNLLSDPDDMQQMVEGVRKTRDLVAQSPFEGLRGAELDPGADVTTDADIRNWISYAVETDFHPAGTCRMGHGPDAVIDDQFRVHGIKGLWVVDASVMPNIVSGNLNAPTQMIAARAADMIAGKDQRAPEYATFAFAR